MLGFLNKRIKKHCLEPYCTIITGDRGTGKSSVFALIAEEYMKDVIGKKWLIQADSQTSSKIVERS